MSDDKDNVVRVDFRSKRLLDDAGAADPNGALDNADGGDGESDDVLDDGVATKLERFAGMIEHGLVLVTFDTRVSGVDVPEHFRGTPQLHLSFSHRFRVDDFAYDAGGIRGTLGFDDAEYHCAIPWDAVYGMSSQVLDERVVFPESFPAELLALLPSLADSGDDSDETD